MHDHLPKLELIGVHRLSITPELVEAQALILHGEALEGGRQDVLDEIRAQLEDTVIVEVLVKDPDERFDLGDFAQRIPGEPEEDAQAAWAEGFLSEDGTTLLGRWEPPPALPRTFRVAFYVHDWRDGLPLTTSYGALECPTPGEMPERLKALVPYEPVD
jgi:hypothetical protein